MVAERHFTAELNSASAEVPTGDPRALARPLAELLAAARHAQPVPLTDQVRLPRERVEELLRDLRTAGA